MTNVGIHSVRERAGDDVEVDWGDLHSVRNGEISRKSLLFSA